MTTNKPCLVKDIIKFLLILLFTIQTSFSQQSSIIKGYIIDVENTPLEFASVALLKPLDSVMVSFAISDKKGLFEITDAPEGNFLLQVYLTGFLPYYKNISTKNKLIDLKNIALKENVEKLNEINITAVVPVQIKNDTVVYNVNSFRVHHDDNIEDLLKKLPGVELNSNGTVTSQGNEITKIYVDGKEFFSGDPAIALKNLSADAITKVEIIDKKSDEAELTGVNDQEKTYVINLRLKKNKRKSGFGKLAAGIGADDKYFSNGNYNRFSLKTQWAVIGKYNNINLSGSNIQDFLNFSGGLGDEEDENNQSSDEEDFSGLSGKLTTGVAGANFGYEFKKKEVFNADYFYNFSENSGTSNSKRTSYLKSKNYFSEAESKNLGTSNNHVVNFNYENKSNKTSSLIINGNLTDVSRTSNINRNVSYFDEMSELRNEGAIQYSNKNDRNKGNIKLNYYKKLDDNKRNFGTGLYITSFKVKNDKEQNTLNTKVSNGRTNEIFIKKDEQFSNNIINFNFNYTEPLGNDHFLRMQSTYLFKNGKEEVAQTKKRNNQEEQPLDYNIENREKRYNTNLTYNYSTEVLNINLGSELQKLYRNFGLIDEENYKQDELYFNPVVSFRYKPKKGINYVFNYRRVIKSPSYYQSSPVVNDLNPYHIKMGNPNLQPEEIDNFNLRTTNNYYRSSLSFFTKVAYLHTKDAIIPTINIDDNFVKTRSFENYGSQDKISVELNLNKRIKKLGLRYNIKTKGSYRTSNSIIELELNDVISKSYLVGFSLENNNKNNIDLKAGANYSLNNTDFSVVQNLNREFVRQHYYTKFDYDITKKFNVNTQFDYFLYSDTRFDSNQKIPFWNASASYAITKNKNGIVKLLLIDILDRNIDIARKSNINYFEETTNQMLGRYFIVSYTHRINGGKPKRRNKSKKNKIS